MEPGEKKSLSILEENSELLKKLPSILGDHLKIYENLHRDLDNSEHSSGHYRNKDESGESNVQELANVSHEFVEALVRLKGISPSCRTGMSGVARRMRGKSREKNCREKTTN